ncbi:MAG: hypothetical protein ABR514_06890 [Chthoniobacterales bacterium]
MKNLQLRYNSENAFTAAEMAVATAVMAVLGLVMFSVLNSGMILYAKNTAVNSAHQEARDGINRLTRDIHAAVSVPQLRDGSFNVVSSAPVQGVPPTAAGVSFQNVVQGSPDYVWKDPGAANLIMVKDNPNKPVPGMHLIVPFWGIEDDIYKVTAAGTTNHSNVFLVNGLEAKISEKAPAYLGTSYAITYYTERVMYLVQGGTYIADSQGGWILSNGTYIPYTNGNVQRYRYERGELHMYKQRYNSNGTSGNLYWQDTTTVARYISSPQPFYIPLNSGGSPDTKYVGVKLTARDPSSSNRGYLATASLLDTQIDYRSRIALYQ